MKSSLSLASLIILFFTACQAPKIDDPTTLSAPFFGLEAMDTATILAPNLISSNLDEYNGTFSPDGKTFFYTSQVANKGYITLMQMNEDLSWSAPEIAPFSGVYSEYDPLFSPDGSRLYFSSERPLKDSTASYGPNIWFVERTGDSWTEPQHVYLSQKGDYYSSIANNGNIYYNIWNTGKILKASPSDTGYVSTELPKIINSRSDVGDPFISPEEDYLIYRAYYQEGFGRGDLYISFNIDGQWTEPENLGSSINSSSHEICPYVTTDGQFFLFASDRISTNYPIGPLKFLREKHQRFDNGQSNIYYISANFIKKMKQKHLESQE